MKNPRELLFVVLYATMAIALLTAPRILSRQVVYRADLSSTGLDAEGYADLANVPMEIGESYTIYLSDSAEGGDPAAEASGDPNEDTKVAIFDSKLQPIANQLTWNGAYSVFSESAYTIGSYTAQEKGPRTLILKFREPPPPSLGSHEIVIRQSGLASPFLLVFSDGSCLLPLIFIGLSRVWQGFNPQNPATTVPVRRLTGQELTKLTRLQRFLIDEYGYLVSPADAESVDKLRRRFRDAEARKLLHECGERVAS